VVTLDLTVEDLVERLRGGKIYAPEKVTWALEHFFKDENLQTLRELVLREVAESVERSAAKPRGDADDERGKAAVGKVMVCMASFSPRAAWLLRRGSRMAGRLSTDWYVAYVETPEEAPDRIDATAQRHLHDNIAMARELGAEVVRLKSRDPVAAILDFARSHAVGHLIIGRSHRPRWKRLFRRDVTRRLLDEADDMDLHVVAFQDRSAS
jgi:two-component system, OmpR family, sensor histidine kinase KdpD